MRARLGYTTAAFARERELEGRFRDSVSPERMSAYHAALTRRPHLAGTDGSRAVADSLRRFLTDAGLDVEVFAYQAYLSLPKEIGVEIVSPSSLPLRVTEPASPLDPDTRNA